MRPFCDCVGVASIAIRGKMAGTTTIFLNNPSHSKSYIKFIRDIGESKTKHVSFPVRRGKLCTSEVSYARIRGEHKHNILLAVYTYSSRVSTAVRTFISVRVVLAGFSFYTHDRSREALVACKCCLRGTLFLNLWELMALLAAYT